MREYLFRGKRVDNGEWVTGYLGVFKGTSQIYVPFTEEEEKENEGHFLSAIGGLWHTVIPESVGQYTGMNEFVVSDRSFNKPLFEGDIVEVWSRRRLPTEYIHNVPSSKYDVKVKAIAVICFKNGEWALDYDNKYNEALCELRGNEQYERTVDANHTLYSFGFHNNNEDWHREHNAHYKWNDIVKIGNVFDNKDLLEG